MDTQLVIRRSSDRGAQGRAALSEPASFGQVGGEKLERDGSLQARVLGLVYDPHAALTELFEDLEVTAGRTYQDASILPPGALPRIRGENKRCHKRCAAVLRKARPECSNALFAGLGATLGGCHVSVKLFLNMCASGSPFQPTVVGEVVQHRFS